MKIKNVINKKKYLIIAITLLVAIMGALVYAYAVNNAKPPVKRDSNSQRTENVDYSEPTPEEVKTGNDKKTETIQKDALPSTPNALSVSITAAQQNNDTVQIRTLIDNIIADGSCILTLTQESKTVTRNVPIQALSSSSTCKGFDIPVNELSNGLWAIDISATSGSISGSAKGTVTVTLE